MKGFLNSDYMFDRLGYDVNTVQRRLGDGLYEQRLIQQAVAARTGKRFLDGLASDEAQFRYLMDNAIASKSALNLMPGIALTAEQVAALTHDIVWMEEQEVNGHKVLVPVLYLAQANDRLAPNGALIQGRDIALISGGELKNNGILRASVNLDVEAERIDNSGLMQANERLQLLATDSIRNAQGGIINGKDVTLYTERGDITNERSIGSSVGRDGGFTWSQSVADNAARIEASNDLTLAAGRDVLNIGGALQAGGNAQLLAGRDLVIGTATEVDSSQAQLKRVRASSQTITQDGSEVSIGGNMVADAGRDLALVASKVQVGRDLAMAAGSDISILSAANESHSFSKSKKVTVSADQVSQQASVIQVGRDMSIDAGNDLTLAASQLKADGSVALQAGQDIQLLAEQDESAYFYSKKKDGSFGRSSSRMTASSSSTAVTSVIEAGQDLTLLAKRDVLSQGAQLASDGALQVAAGHDIYLGAAENTRSQESAKTRSGLTSSRARSNASSASMLTGTSLDAQSIDLLAGNDVTLEASSVRADGAARLSAGQDLNIVTAEQYQSSSSFKQSSKLGLSPSIATGVSVSLTEKGQRAQQNSSQAVGSQLSAGSLELESGRDTAILASTLVADGAIDITAGRNLLVGSAENHESRSSQSSVRKVGDVGEWYAPSYGRAKQSQSETSSVTQQVGSQIASLGGDINLKAGEGYRQTASDVLTLEGDIDIAARQVDIEAGYDRFEATHKASSSTTAVGGSVSVPLVEAARSLDQLNNTTKKTDDGRLQALAAATAAIKVYAAADDVAAVAKGDMPGFKVSISLGNSRSSSTTTQSGKNAVGSTVNAGGNLTISATGAGEASDINVVGSQLKAGGNASLDAEGDISLRAAKNTAEQHSDNSGSGWSVGVGISVGGTANGLTLDLAANQSRGNADGSDLSWSNSSIQAGNQVDLVSGGDTTLKGAVVSGERVVADVGGNLNIESLQDTSTYESEQKSMGVGASICIPGFCAGASSVSASHNQQKIDSNYASVSEQSGIKAGDGGFDITVNGNTDLKGAVIASSQAADSNINRLTTATLSATDITNYATANVESSGIGFSSGMGAYGFVKAIGGYALTGASESDDDINKTYSAISKGHIVITDSERQQALYGLDAEKTLTDINRDTDNAHSTARRLDVEAMVQAVEVKREIREESFKEITAQTTDLVYKQQTADKKIILQTCDAGGTNCRQTQVSADEVKVVDGKVYVFNNGIMNSETQALDNAAKQSDAAANVQGVYVIVNPHTGNPVAEVLTAGWDKLNEILGAALPISSAAEANIGVREAANNQSGVVIEVSHSRGTLTSSIATAQQLNDGVNDAAIGSVTFNGAAANAQRMADRVDQVTGGQGVVLQSTHKDDFVGTFFGWNTPTGGLDSSFPNSHGAYTGGLPAEFNLDGSYNGIRELTNKAWGEGEIGRPVIVRPKDGF